MNKQFLFTLLIINSLLLANAQFSHPPKHLIEQAPTWAQMMYADTPNVVEVTRVYRTYYKGNSYEKNIHTKNYKEICNE